VKPSLPSSLLLLGALGLGAALPLAHPQQQLTTTQIAFENAPVGSILAWHRDLPGTPVLPAGWETCDGQMVTDPASPYFGTLLPDLNGEARYLRGGLLSGVLQDDATAANGLAATTDVQGSHVHAMNSSGSHSHTRGNVGGIGSTRGFAAAGSQSGSTSTSTAGSHTHSINPAGAHGHTVSVTGDAETRPITMSVVWILRIR